VKEIAVMLETSNIKDDSNSMSAKTAGMKETNGPPT
jgi:hypothetical protein